MDGDSSPFVWQIIAALPCSICLFIYQWESQCYTSDTVELLDLVWTLKRDSGLC